MTKWAGTIIGEEGPNWVIRMHAIRRPRLLRLARRRGLGWLRQFAIGPADHTVVHPK